MVTALSLSFLTSPMAMAAEGPLMRLLKGNSQTLFLVDPAHQEARKHEGKTVRDFLTEMERSRIEPVREYCDPASARSISFLCHVILSSPGGFSYKLSFNTNNRMILSAVYLKVE